MHHIYGPFADRKRCRFDRPGKLQVVSYFSFGEKKEFAKIFTVFINLKWYRLVSGVTAVIHGCHGHGHGHGHGP